MDDEERQLKLAAGKARLASFRKKKSSKKRKKDDKNPLTPRDSSYSEVGAGDSIAVNTGDDSQALSLSTSEDSERSSTTADEISTEEETGSALGLTPAERLVELELTVSDQQVALQKLTMENKDLRDQSEMSSQTISERDFVINELRDNVGETAQHVRQLQHQLTRATDAVKDTGGEKGQIVNELVETRIKLDAYQNAITRQEENLQMMAAKLEQKSIEAGEAIEKCNSLQTELDKTRSVLSADVLSESARAELERNKELMQIEMEESHGKQIAALNEEHQNSIKDLKRKYQIEMEDARSEQSSGITFDPEDHRALREQVAILNSQLENAFRENDNIKRIHDKEVIKLNQQLVSNVDEYETKLQEEKENNQEFEHRLEMVDAVSSEIQASFSKQLEQIEIERDHLRAQLKQLPIQAKENSNFKKQNKDLSDEVMTYQTELAEMSQKLENSEKQRRQLRDDFERFQESTDSLKGEKSHLLQDCENYKETISQLNIEQEQLNEKLETSVIDIKELNKKYSDIAEELRSKEREWEEKREKSEEENNEKVKLMNNEHSDELKNLHTQHHRQMDELKKGMENQIETTRNLLEVERKQQLGTVKDVHERTHEREIERLNEEQEEKRKHWEKKRESEMKLLREEIEEESKLREENLRIELNKIFDNKLESELETLRRSLEKEAELALLEESEKHKDEMREINQDHQKQLEDVVVAEELKHKELLEGQKSQLDEALDSMKEEFIQAQNTMETEHADALTKMEAELESIQNAQENLVPKSQIEKLETSLRESEAGQETLKQEMSNLKQNLESEARDMEEDYKEQIRVRDATLKQEREKWEEEQEDYRDKMEEEGNLWKEQMEKMKREIDLLQEQTKHEAEIKESEHEEEFSKMREDMGRMKMRYEERCEAMQVEIEGLRTSKKDLQDLRQQLLARTSSVEDLEKMKEENLNQLELLKSQHQEQVEKIKQEHEEESRNYQDKLEQLLQDLNESREKMLSPPSPKLESSPMRSLSAMSDYDSSNVPALSKDYRSAMQLTNISDVSGLSEQLEEEVEEDSAPQEEKLVEEKEKLNLEVETLTQEIEKLKSSHDDEIEKLKSEHEAEVKRFSLEQTEALDKLEATYEQSMEELKESHMNLLNKLKEEQQTEIMQIQLQCASNTAAQIEEETQAIKQKMKDEFEKSFASHEHQTELESKVKILELQKTHDEALKKQSEDLSDSMQVRISAVMTELHQQQQHDADELVSKHKGEIKSLVSEFEDKLREMEEEKEKKNREWKIKMEEKSKEIEKLQHDMSDSENKMRQFTDDLESGRNENIILLQTQHKDELENLKKEHELNKENSLKDQALTFQNAQEEFIKNHEAQMSQFIQHVQEGADSTEKNILSRVQEIQEKLQREFEEEKQTLSENHNEELKIVATKLVAIHEEKQEVEKAKIQLENELEALISDKEKDLATLKTNLVAQHMAKFQEVTATLELHHQDQIEMISSEKKAEENRLTEEVSALSEKIKELEKGSMSREEHQQRMNHLEEEKDEKIKKIQEEHDAQLDQIEQEIKKQNEEHQESMGKILNSQGSELSSLQQHFDKALKKATEASIEEAQKLAEKVVELEYQLKGAESLKKELDQVNEKYGKLTRELEEKGENSERWEEERNEEREAYEDKLQELSDALNNSREEFQDLSARIEFERAEYETEVESAQDEVRVKDENIKELESEISKKKEALEILQLAHEQLTTRRERETQEGGNLLEMLRDDLDRINKERDQMSNSNEQLLSTLSELIRANQRCEDLITKRLQNLPLQGGETQTLHSSSSSNDLTPPETNLSATGSFVDEGLDLSQRLAESMFVGPDLDPDARENVTNTGLRVGQAVERLLDMLQNSIQQLNSAQQAQTMLGEELERVVEEKRRKEEEKEMITDGEDINLDADHIRLASQLTKTKELLHERSSQVSELENRLHEQEELMKEAAEHFKEKQEELEAAEAKIEEENLLLNTQRDAIKEGKDETELNLLRITEELASEKQILLQRHAEERKRMEDTARHLEDAVEASTRIMEERENVHLEQIEDLNNQITALTKQSVSGNQLAAELTNDREVERDQFEKDLEAMREEIDQARDTAKTESLLAEKVEFLEEELDSKQKTHEQEVKEKDEELAIVKKKVQEQEEELKQQFSDAMEIEQLRTEVVTGQVDLEEARRQQDVLKEELYQNMLRISALEAQLDRYRHGVDEDKLASIELSEQEAKDLLEQKKQELEFKDNEIVDLLETQNSLRQEIIEKEEQVEKLLEDSDKLQEIEAENIKLKEELEQANERSSHPEVTESERLQALSHHLLEEKNSEIDSLKQQLLCVQGGEHNTAQRIVASLQQEIKELTEENQLLKDEIVANMEGQEEQEELEVAPKDDDSDKGDTGIHEVDLTVGDLTRREEQQRLEVLLEENLQLRETLKKVHDQEEDENLLPKISEAGEEEGRDVFNLPPSIKEMIRDLEERLEKEINDKEEDLMSFSTDDVDNMVDGEIFQEKLGKVEEELKRHPETVVGRILINREQEKEKNQIFMETLNNDLDHLAQENKQLKEKLHTLEAQKLSADVEIALENERDLIRINNPGAVQKEESTEVDADLSSTNHSDEESASSSESESENSSTSLSRDSSSEENREDEDKEKCSDASEVFQNKEDLKNMVELMRIRILENDKIIGDKSLMLEELEAKCEKMTSHSNELEQALKQSEVDIEKLELDLSNQQLQYKQEVENLEEKVQEALHKLSTAEKENENQNVMLTDVQKECAALLEDNHKLEMEKNSLKQFEEEGKKLEDLLREKENEFDLEVERGSQEKEGLLMQIKDLDLKANELECEVNTMKQSHLMEIENLTSKHEADITQFEFELTELKDFTRVETEVNQLDVSAPAELKSCTSSTSSEESSENPEEFIQNLRLEHQKKIEDIQLKFALELEEAVEDARKGQEERDEARIQELQQKHRFEISEILSESISGDNDLAHRLRNELDLADRLDNDLISQLTSATDGLLSSKENGQSNNSSPSKDVSEKLQHLLSRLHNEGVQVLSLSELQFIKQNQSNQSISAQTSDKPDQSVDIDALKLAWETEKLALVDAIQTLKELLTQTANDAANLTDDDQSLLWRGELLRAIADLFERERNALLAELRANVIEAQANIGEDLNSSTRLEALERKIRNQDLQHKSELERLLAADRDRLVFDIDQLKQERKEQLRKAKEKINELQTQCNAAEDLMKQTQAQHKHDVGLLDTRLHQGETICDDLKTSLESERAKSQELLHSLEEERERVIELNSECALLSKNAERENSKVNEQIENMSCELDKAHDRNHELEEYLNQVLGKNDKLQSELVQEKEKQLEKIAIEEEQINDLRSAIKIEEKHKVEAFKAVEIERDNVNALHQELNAVKSTARDDILQLHNRCEDLSSEIQSEQVRNEELRSALDRETLLSRRVREELEEERKVAAEARSHDRAAVNDLQTILEEAKKDTERVQMRVEVAEKEKEEIRRIAEEENILARRRLEEERVARDDAILNERRARNELQSALETEKTRKREAQKRIKELEELHMRTLSPREDQENLLARRRQLESIRQHLQLEASKLQNLMDHPRTISPASRSSTILSSDGERLESLKRSLGDIQEELKDLYSNLSLPNTNETIRPGDFNDKLLERNAELADHAAQSASEMRRLKDAIDVLQDQRRAGDITPPVNSSSHQNQQKMASRMHKLYTRYLRAESFRKSLVYQKKYLLLLLGGFQDCEEATLALIARMGAYPTNDSLRKPIQQRSRAFTRFRSAVRVVIAVCRLKFLVNKWKRASNTVSQAIQSKHGYSVSSPSLNGFSAQSSRTRIDPMTSSRTPSPGRISPYYGNYPAGDSHDIEHGRGHAERPYDLQRPVASYAGGFPPDRGFGARRDYVRGNGDSRIDNDQSSYMNRSRPSHTDPSLNEYIQKLENIQNKLGQASSTRYPR